MQQILMMARDVNGNLHPIAVDAEGRLALASGGCGEFATATFGDFPTNYSEFENDGTLIAYGDATCFRDELQSVTGAQITSPSADFQINIPEGSVTAEASARYPADYITTNWQLNHDWKSGTVIYPHIHWWQTTVNEPNWILAYRWQIQSGAKATTWNDLRFSANIFAYTAGTLNQITRFPTITPPVGYGQVSDIVQVRLYRDVTNVSGLFDASETSPVDQDVVNLDVHIEVDMFGSAQEYRKYNS